LEGEEAGGGVFVDGEGLGGCRVLVSGVLQVLVGTLTSMLKERESLQK